MAGHVPAIDQLEPDRLLMQTDRHLSQLATASWRGSPRICASWSRE